MIIQNQTNLYINIITLSRYLFQQLPLDSVTELLINGIRTAQ